METELITGVIEDLAKTISTTAAEALTIPNLDKCKTEFRQDSSESGIQTTFLYIRDTIGNVIYKINIELHNIIKEHEERVQRG